MKAPLIKILILFMLGLHLSLSQAEMIDSYQFSQPEERQRAVALAKTLRCPQCQNQNLVESNSPIAYDLRIEVYDLVEQGKTNEQIIELMTERFGHFVYYKPPFMWSTALLWCLPLLLLAFALLAIYRHSKIVRQAPSTLSVQQQQQLKELLQNNLKTGNKLTNNQEK